MGGIRYGILIEGRLGYKYVCLFIYVYTYIHTYEEFPTIAHMDLTSLRPEVSAPVCRWSIGVLWWVPILRDHRIHFGTASLFWMQPSFGHRADTARAKVGMKPKPADQVSMVRDREDDSQSLRFFYGPLL